MVQLFSIFWGFFNAHLLLNFGNSGNHISLEDVNKFFTKTAIKYMIFFILGYFIIFEATGYLLCYLYLDFNTIIKIIFWISVGISSLTMIMVIIAVSSIINDLMKMENNIDKLYSEDDSENKSNSGSNIFHVITKFNLILLIILSIFLFRLFIN